MNKTPDPVEVIRDKLVPAAEELLASVAERVAPLAKEAVDSVSPAAQAAAERTVALVHTAAEKVAPLTHSAVDAVTPLAQQTREAVAPYAHSAVSAVGPYAQKVGPLAHSAADRVGPLAQQAAGAVAPYVVLVREQGRKTGHDIAERLEPAYEAAIGALSGARDRVTTEVLPVVGAVATTAATSASPFVTAATERGRALVGRGKEEVVVEVVPEKKKRGWLTTFAVVAAAAGATYVVVRKLVGDKGSSWQAARPSTPYVPPTSASSAAGASTGADAGSDQQTGPSAHDIYREADGAAEPDQPAEGGLPDISAEAGAPRSASSSSSTAPAGGAAEPSTLSLYGTVAEPDQAAGTDEDATAVTDNLQQTDRVADADQTVAPLQTEQHSGSHSGSSTSFSTQQGASGPDDEPTSPYSEERVATELETVQERAYEEPEDAVLAGQDQAAGVGPDAHPERYLGIPGVYVGVEPPEGYTIKGNERSMKYHLPESNSYRRTIAEVWFLNEDAAQQAGFTRAEH